MFKYVSIMASKPITFCWIRTGSQLTEKSCIFCEYQNLKINTSFASPGFRPLGADKSYNFSFSYPPKAVYNTLR